MRFLFPVLFAGLAFGSDCTKTSVGLTPFTSPFPATYKGYQVSLYPSGNTRPAAHQALGLKQAAQVVPRDASGAPSASGRIVLLSIGMSNTTMEFSAFLQVARNDARRAPYVWPVDGAVGGQTASIIQNPDAPYWQQVDQRLAASNVTREQVQVVWLKEADAGPTQGFPAYAKQLQTELSTIVRLLRTRFVNLKIVYLSNRIYAGYATSALNPEPYAYESAFAVKWLIEQQINGAPDLSVADGKAPWLAWGPDLWADGKMPRMDGLAWTCGDLQASDGTHPSSAGAAKVASMLLDFFHSDSTARSWYLAAQTAPKPAIPALMNPAGWGAAVATGSLATLRGENFAAAEAQAPGFPLPHELGGTRVEVDSVPMPLYYVSPQQINFVAPLGGQTLTVVRGETASDAIPLGLVYWAPGLLTLDSRPDGPAAAIHADGTVIDSAHPARAGETVAVFGTGLGLINPMLLIAQPEPVVLVGGNKAPEVSYCGAAPGLPGVTQVNFKIPDGVTGASSLVFQLGAAASNAASLAVQ